MNFVLMSTFNGEKFVSQQIDSIISQVWTEPCHLIIRDDGSTDQTLSIIFEKKIKCNRRDIKITIIEGENVGVVDSFHILLNSIAPHDDDLIFLCDQDDVWLPDRASHVVNVFTDSNIDIYCGALSLVNQDLKKIANLNHLDLLGRPHGFPLLVNFITGCALCVRGAVFGKLNFKVSKTSIPMHDWWIATQVYFYSLNYFYDGYPTILYRQHDGNVVGVQSIKKKIFSLKFWQRRLSSSVKITHISNLDESLIGDRDLLMQKRFFECHGNNMLGRFRIAKKFFCKAKLSKWLIFIFLK